MRAAVPFRESIQAFFRRDASTHVVFIMAIGALFAAAAYAGVHSSRYWDDLFRIVMLRSQQGWSGVNTGRQPRQGQGTDESLRLLDPRDAFAQARVGLLKFSMNNSDVCRHVMFDNRTGSLIEAGLTACGRLDDAEAANNTWQNRALAMQRAFRK